MLKLYIEKNGSSKDLLKKVLKENNIDEEIIYNEYGKPYLKNNEIYFNISHKDNYTVLVTSKKEVGVDIEKITFKERLLNKIASNEEKKLIKNAEDFTKLWVKKESYVKYLGRGLSYGLKNVDTLKLQKYQIKKYQDYYIAIYGDEVKEV